MIKIKWIFAPLILVALAASTAFGADSGSAKEDYRALLNKEYKDAGFAAPPAPVPGIWSLWAEEDLFGIRAVIMSNHPGAAFDPKIPKDAAFLKQLNSEFNAQVKAARRVRTEEDYNKFIQAYVDKFGDGHMSISRNSVPDLASEAVMLVVRYSEAIAKKSGDTKAKDKVTKIVKEVEKKHAQAGQTNHEKLMAKYAPTSFTNEFGALWLKFPSFDLLKEFPEAHQEIQQRYSDLFKKIDNLAAVNYIVIDVRGNRGGDPDPGEKLYNDLYGSELGQKWTAFSQPRSLVWRRSSQGIVARYRDLITEEKDPEKWNRGLIRILLSMSRSLVNDQQVTHFVDESKNPPKDCKIERAGALRTRPDIKVYVLTDEKCASACLMTIEPFLHCTDAIHVGVKTGHKERYMEGTRELDIASGRWNIRIPVMGIDETYRPDKGYIPKHQASEKVFASMKTPQEWLDKIAARKK